MKTIALTLQKHYNFSNYQMKQLEYLFASILSELSKFLILGILFHSKWQIYLVCIAVMMLVRGVSGGLHCKTYLACLSLSSIYLFLAIYILPMITVSKTVMLIALLLCCLITYYIGPVTSVYRPVPSPESRAKSKTQVFVIIFFYLILTYLLPESIYITSGFWIIILHTMQLMAAYFMKGVDFMKGLNFMKWFKGFNAVLKGFDTAIYKVLCACMAFSYIMIVNLKSVFFFGELPYPEPEEN